jgi:hypothetical protein
MHFTCCIVESKKKFHFLFKYLILSTFSELPSIRSNSTLCIVWIRAYRGQHIKGKLNNIPRKNIEFNNIKYFKFVRCINHFVFEKMTSYKFLSPLISSNWTIEFKCLFSGALYVVPQFENWGRIFSRVWPFCERAVSDLDP